MEMIWKPEKKMHNASCMAGMAFNNAALGLNHGMAHTIGAKYHISHGRSNAIILPYVIEYNADIREFNSEHMETAQRYAYLAGIIGVPSASVRQAVRNLIESIKDLLIDISGENYSKIHSNNWECLKKNSMIIWMNLLRRLLRIELPVQIPENHR